MTDEPSDRAGVLTAEPEATDAAVRPLVAAAVPLWQRPNVERYLLPLFTPVAVVLGLVVFVLNLSRVFLSAHGHIAVVVGSVITGAILFGATVLSNSTRLRSSSISFATAGFVFLIVSGGWLVLGHSQAKTVGGGALTAAGPYNGTFEIVSQPSGSLAFGPSSLTVKTGVYLVTLKDGANGRHTLDFDAGTTTRWASLAVNTQGETHQSRIFFGTPGNYTFFCAVPTHRAAGMQGVVHVTGAPITLAQAEASGKASTAGPTATK